VVASFLNGGVCVLIMARAVLDRGVRWGREHVGGARSRAPRPRPATGRRPRPAPINRR
jgi:undecaprenyl-diphosphatase